MQFKITNIELFYGSVMPYPFKRLQGFPLVEGHWGDTKDVDPRPVVKELGIRLGHTLEPAKIFLYDRDKAIEEIEELAGDADERIVQIMKDTYADWPPLHMKFIGNGYTINLEPAA